MEAESADAMERYGGFTERQKQVVKLIAEGCSNHEVAARLGISPRTAKAHSDVLRTKLRVGRRRQIPLAFRQLTGQDPHTLPRLEETDRGAMPRRSRTMGG